MKKYIIKNCIANENNVCDSQDVFCEDCSDCLLKQIVEKCKENEEGTTVEEFQREVINLLDISEVKK